MAGSTYGTIFKITTWGESHGKALGVVIDGCPAGLPLTEDDIQTFLDRRKPGQSAITTQRKEADEIEILSGTFEGVTTGTPISMMVRNTSQISRDYGNLAEAFRPGHADYTFENKYGVRDYRGGGRSSGRETVGRVAAGAVASKILSSLGVSIKAYTKSIGPVTIDDARFDSALIGQLPTGMPDPVANEEALLHLQAAREACDSVGGCMECVITGMPIGIGDPVFEKLDANLAKAIMSIGAVKAVEIGDGIRVGQYKGSENNDPFVIENGAIQKKTNHSGGILGGMSDGSPVIIRAHVKPTPSIYQEQQTVTKSGEEITLAIKGRHDPIIVPRALVVMECMTALTVLDAMMIHMCAKLDSMKEFYQ